MNGLKILILEDDLLFSESLEDFLQELKFQTDICYNGEDALDRSYENSYDLLLLDINVPKLNGFEVLQNIRKQNDNTPAIFITSYKDKDSILRGFDKGADDYIVKPIDLDELQRRITALLKRSNKLVKDIQIGKFKYNKIEKKLYNTYEEFLLPDKVSKLLEILIENKNSIVPKEILLNSIWNWGENSSEGSLRVYINELKKILGKDMIDNQKGVGYKLKF